LVLEKSSIPRVEKKNEKFMGKGAAGSTQSFASLVSYKLNFTFLTTSYHDAIYAHHELKRGFFSQCPAKRFPTFRHQHLNEPFTKNEPFTHAHINDSPCKKTLPMPPIVITAV
jgi:hypothetical protein